MNGQYYVYIYKMPRSREVIYIGKGKNGRALVHWLTGTTNNAFGQILKKLYDKNLKPIISIINMKDEETAFVTEAQLIHHYGCSDIGVGPLCNSTPYVGRERTTPYMGKVWPGIKNVDINAEWRRKFTGLS